MDQTLLDTFNAVGAIGSALTGIAALFGIIKYVASQKVKNELLYGEEADERIKHIKEHFKEGSYATLPKIPYGGRDIIVPRLQITKISTGSKTISKDWKGKTAIVKYYKNATSEELETFKANKDYKEMPTISIERWLI